MKILEFENTQGINLQYATASIAERLLAFIIDLILLLIGLGIIGLITKAMKLQTELLYYLFFVPFLVFYTPLMEIFNDGQSVGKMAMGIKVIRIDGRPVKAYDYLMRGIFRVIDIYLAFGSVAVLMISASPRGQRLGDVLADTTVIQTRQGRIALKRILKLSELKGYKPKYPEARKLSEEQVMFVKSALERSKGNRNEHHKALRAELAARLKAELNVTEPIAEKAFLQTVIKDYIALTR